MLKECEWGENKWGETNASVCAGWAVDFMRQLVLQGLVPTAELFIAEWRVAWLAVKPFSFFLFISYSAIHSSLSFCLLSSSSVSPLSLSCLCLFLSSPPSLSGSKGWWSVKLESVSYSALWLHVLSYKLQLVRVKNNMQWNRYINMVFVCAWVCVCVWGGKEDRGQFSQPQLILNYLSHGWYTGAFPQTAGARMD